MQMEEREGMDKEREETWWQRKRERGERGGWRERGRDRAKRR